jgi:hypothetical protein
MRDGNSEKWGGALLPACRLWSKTSAKGTAYLTGRLGNLRVVILPRRDDDEGDFTHVLMLSEAAPRDGSER